MHIDIQWMPRIVLSKASKGFLDSVGAFDISRIPRTAGVYVFARQHGQNIEPIYVGKALDLQLRVSQQLNNLKLMKAVNDSKTGSRVLLIGEVLIKRGQNKEKVVKLLERSHIEAAQAAGHPIVNVQGARPKTHAVRIVGKKPRNHPFERNILTRDAG
jgi:hypothetical protein